MMEEYIKAGKIASAILKKAQKKATAGTKVQDLIVNAEKDIIKSGASLAFPCNVSINSISHYTSGLNDTTILLDGDIVKMDLGVEIDGYIADTATTVLASGENPEKIPDNMPGRTDTADNTDSEKKLKLQEATLEALLNAISIIKEGTTISQIGKTIHETALKYSFDTVPNITGHSINRYRLHSQPVIPNHKNDDTTALKEGDIIAVEPHLSYNNSKAIKTHQSNMYSYLRNRPFHDKKAVQLMEFIQKNHQRFPFALRHIQKYNPTPSSINALITSRALFPYPVLVQADNYPVAQFEHTIIVEKRGCKITTK